MEQDWAASQVFKQENGASRSELTGPEKSLDLMLCWVTVSYRTSSPCFTSTNQVEDDHTPPVSRKLADAATFRRYC